MATSKNQPTTETETDAPGEPVCSGSFEEALEELQEIVSELEDGALGLEESMQRFEKGVELLRCCYRVLEESEQRIDILTGTDADGNPVTAPFDGTATIEQSGQTIGMRKRKHAAGKTGNPNQDADEQDSGKTLF